MDLKQMLFSMLAGSTASLSYFVVSFCLDHYINYNLSTLIGLMVDAIIDFILQELVFMRKIVLQKYIVIKFIIGQGIFIGFNGALFSYLESFIRENKNKKYKLLILRVLLNFVLFVLILFPIRKYFIYNTKRFFM